MTASPSTATANCVSVAERFVRASLDGAVMHVGGLVAQKQVRGIATLGVIAAVADEQAGRDGAAVKRPRKPVGEDDLLRGRNPGPEHAIPVGRLAGEPAPTAALAVLCNLRPKPVHDRFRPVCAATSGRHRQLVVAPVCVVTEAQTPEVFVSCAVFLGTSHDLTITRGGR